MPAGSAPFARVGIAGVGLIGGSLAAALRSAWPTVEIAALDRPEVLAEASARGLINRRAGSADDLADADLIVLATPVVEILNLLPAIARLRTNALVTDVGSTKRTICQVARQAGLSRFVGGHTMAGAERPGLVHGRANLFEGQPWLLVPGSTSDDDLARLERFVRGTGALPHRVDAETHDRTMAYVSHLPQLVAVALMHTAGRAIGDAGLRLSGRAFAEMTRLAASPADLWQGILATNADNVAAATAALAAALPPPAPGVELARWIGETFQEAGKWRERLDHARATEHGSDQ